MNIYKITNLINGKIYIGKTIQSLHKRFIGHKTDARCHSPCHLHRAMMKYGFENFKIELIDTADTAKELSVKEFYWIQALNSCDRNIGYNIQSGNEEGDLVIDTKLKIRMVAGTKRKKISKNLTSKYLGVFYLRGRKEWGYSINFDSKNRKQKRFLTPEDAAYARDLALIDLFGECSDVLVLMNFPKRIQEYKSDLVVPQKCKLKHAVKKSSFNGVLWEKEWKKWRASIISPEGKRFRSGLFSTEAEAAEKYDLMCIELNLFDTLNFDASKYENPNYIPPKCSSEKFPYPPHVSLEKQGKKSWFRVRIKNPKFDKICKTLEEAIETLKTLGLPTTR